jgi:hypothetical protein
LIFEIKKKSQELLVGGQLECHFQKQVIFTLFFVQYFEQFHLLTMLVTKVTRLME